VYLEGGQEGRGDNDGHSLSAIAPYGLPRGVVRHRHPQREHLGLPTPHPNGVTARFVQNSTQRGLPNSGYL